MRHLRGNRLDSLKQGATGFFLIGGLIVSSIAVVLIIMFTMGGVFRGTYTRNPLTNQITDAGTLNFVPLAILLFVVGLVMMVGAVAYGFFVSATERSGPRRTHAAKVLARYGYSRDGHMLVSEWEIEGAENPRFYVRLDMGAELGTTECECSEQVYYQCGEGMTGTATIQGKWLGSFIPAIGAHFQSEFIADDALPQVKRDV